MNQVTPGAYQTGMGCLSTSMSTLSLLHPLMVRISHQQMIAFYMKLNTKCEFQVLHIFSGPGSFGGLTIRMSTLRKDTQGPWTTFGYFVEKIKRMTRQLKTRGYCSFTIPCNSITLPLEHLYTEHLCNNSV